MLQKSELTKPMIMALLHQPWCVGIIFIPFAVLLWSLKGNFFDLPIPSLRFALEAFQLLLLGGGVLFYWLSVRLPHSMDRLDATTRNRRWQSVSLAFLVALVAIAAQLLVSDGQINTHLDPSVMISRLIHYLLFVALAEELWFRGLWMRATWGRFFLSVGGGALGFAVLHWPAGLGAVATTGALGVLFGVARWHGASLLGLVLAHGIMDWVSRVLVPAENWRFSPIIAQLVFCFLILAAAGLIHFYWLQYLNKSVSKAA